MFSLLLTHTHTQTHKIIYQNRGQEKENIVKFTFIITNSKADLMTDNRCYLVSAALRYLDGTPKKSAVHNIYDLRPFEMFIVFSVSCKMKYGAKHFTKKKNAQPWTDYSKS